MSAKAVAAANRILTITDNGSGVARMTTAAAHGLSTDEVIDITGTSVAAYNEANVTVVTVSATVFDTDLSYTADGTGGTWALA